MAEGQAELHQPFIDTNRHGRELFHQTCFDGEANPMYPVLALSLSFPKEGVATGWFCRDPSSASRVSLRAAMSML